MVALQKKQPEATTAVTPTRMPITTSAATADDVLLVLVLHTITPQAMRPPALPVTRLSFLKVETLYAWKVPIGALTPPPDEGERKSSKGNGAG